MESPSDLANLNSKSVKFMAHFTRWDSMPPFETNDHFLMYQTSKMLGKNHFNYSSNMHERFHARRLRQRLHQQ